MELIVRFFLQISPRALHGLYAVEAGDENRCSKWKHIILIIPKRNSEGIIVENDLLIRVLEKEKEWH